MVTSTRAKKVVDDYIARGTLNLTKIVFPENLGRVAALNAGHNTADADILIRCDDDLEPGPDYVANHLRLHRDYDGVIGTLNNIFPKTAYSQVYGTYRDAKFKEAALGTPESERWHYWNGNSSVSAELYRTIGGFDPAYRLYGWEDVDLGKMIADAGGKIIIPMWLKRSIMQKRPRPLCEPFVPCTRAVRAPFSCVNMVKMRMRLPTLPGSGVPR